MAKRATIGIDIGGTKILFALFDERFKVVEEIKEKTDAGAGEKRFTEKLTESVETLLKKAEKEGLQILSAGVGCAGVVDPEGETMAEAASVPFLKGYRLQSRLAKAIGTNVLLANDVLAGLYGEQQFGAATGCHDVIAVFFGTGIGGAVMLDGKLYKGTTGRAGNIGHYVLQPMDSETSKIEILDNLASRTAIAGDAASMAVKQQAPHLLQSAGTDVLDIRSSEIAKAIERGDESIETLVRTRARLAGMAISNMVDFLNPEMVLLGGGLVEELPQLMTEEVQKAVRAYSAPDAAKAVKVAASKLKAHAVTTGAAKLALDSFLNVQASEPAVAR
jgi:glucokinase